jgi:folate-binding protein YgfZ
VRKLTPGTGCEAFLTNVQGKTLGHALIYVGPESIVVDTVPGESEKLLKHLDRYLVCEQVTLADRSLEHGVLLLAGAEAHAVIQSLTGIALGEHRFAHATATLAGRPVELRRADMVGAQDMMISAGAADIAAVREALAAAGAGACDYRAFEAARIEQGFPWFGRDVTDANLPQEIGRDAAAISFVKGCYLGQETVARIDALGHVNKTLVGVRFSCAEVPEPGVELRSGDAVVGTVTSATNSPRHDAPLAQAFVRRGHQSPGTELQSELGSGVVVVLPVR